MADRPVSEQTDSERSYEGAYMIDRAGTMSSAIGLARLALSDGDAAKAARILDDCCDDLHEAHWLACLNDGYAPASIERLLGPRNAKVRRSWLASVSPGDSDG